MCQLGRVFFHKLDEKGNDAIIYIILLCENKKISNIMLPLRSIELLNLLFQVQHSPL